MATDNKYDRQLRLWGANGQRALCSTHIILINATACGTETLKNLVLPGIGSFHVLDDQTLPANAAANGDGESGSGKTTVIPPFSNFFAPVTDDTAGKPRAEVACRLLSELNDDVKGTYEHIDSNDNGGGGLAEYPFSSQLLKAHDDDGDGASVLVVGADLPLSILLPVAALCHDRNVPLVAVKSYGFIGTVRVQCPHHPIIESKPDNSPPDLRLAHFDPPFEPLRSLVDGVTLDDLDDKAHRHVPYVVVLMKALERWRGARGGAADGQRFPVTFAEKNEYKEVIKSMSRKFGEEMNFQEAYNDAYLGYNRRELPDDVRELLDASSSSSATPNPVTTSFDVLVAALREYLKANGDEPPLNGSIPDMTSSTASFIELQQAYHKKATEDLEKFTRCVEAVPADVNVSAEDISLFCKNVYDIRLLSTRSIAEEYKNQTSSSSTTGNNGNDEVRDDLLMHLMDPSDPPEHTPLLWYLALRACEIYQNETNGPYPGSDSRQLSLQSDVTGVHSHLTSVCKNMGLFNNDKEENLVSRMLVSEKKHVEEMVRYNNAELHNVASVVGGVASQEVVKIVTKQYVPLDNTFVFNGIVGIGGVYQF